MAAAGTVQVAAGQSIVRGGIEFTCAAGGTDCTVTIANDGTATSTGGTVTAMNAMASEFGQERLMASPLASPEASSAADTLASFVDSDVLFGPVVAPVKYETDEFGDRGLVPLDDGDGAAYVESVTVLDSQGRFSIVYVVDDVRTKSHSGQSTWLVRIRYTGNLDGTTGRLITPNIICGPIQHFLISRLLSGNIWALRLGSGQFARVRFGRSPYTSWQSCESRQCHIRGASCCYLFEQFLKIPDSLRMDPGFGAR